MEKLLMLRREISQQLFEKREQIFLRPI